MKYAFPILVLLFLLPVVTAVDYPEPQGYLNDYAGILKAPEKAEIRGKLERFEQNTGAEVVVVIVQDMQGLDSSTYAVELFEEWGIGKKGEDNGLLLLLSMEERAWRIEVGYGLEPVITDSVAGRIGRQKLVPEFQQENYAVGINAVVDELEKYILGEEQVVEEYSPSGIDTRVFFVFFLILILVGPVIRKFTGRIHNKGFRWGTRGILGILAAVLIGLLSLHFAIFFFVFWIMMMTGRGGGLFFMPGFGRGGFGGFGGGGSGGGGAGGRW